MKKKNNKKKSKGTLTVVLFLIVIVLAVNCVFMLVNVSQHIEPEVTDMPVASEIEEGTQATENVQIEAVEAVDIDLGEGLVIRDIGSYAGIYMEDGTDEVVSGILMLMVTNNGEATVQYAEISLTVGDRMASFTMSTLPVGKSMILLEQSRMTYDKTADYTDASVKNLAFFPEEPGMCEDKIQIQSLDGAMNIQNISGNDITGDIVVYYKNSSADMLYGGITYRVRITGGLKAGEVRQIVSSHYSTSGSSIMFVTCG